MRFKIYIIAFFAIASFFSTSCRKEVLEPDFAEAPRFFVEAVIEDKAVNIYSGKDGFVASPKVDKAELVVFNVALFSSNFTNLTDSLQVGFLDVQMPLIAPVLPSKEALEKLLSNARKNSETLFSDYPGVSVRWVSGGRVYTSPAEAELQQKSYFRISAIEEYTPPGADHSMKKVDVTFACTLQNPDEPYLTRRLTNGKATLLFDYK